MLNQEIFNSWAANRYEIWLFGTGEYAKAVYAYLKIYGVKVCGFVVTAGQGYAETGEKIVSVSDFASPGRSPYRLILAVGCNLYNEIIPKLVFAAESLYFLSEDFKMQCLAKRNMESLAEKCAKKTENVELIYDSDFYSENLRQQTIAADCIVSAITAFIKPKSIIDVGCGAGLIAKTFLQYGAQEAYGVDGDYIDKTRLQLDTEFFIPFDLTKPFAQERRYDLALSLEVAEHLDEQYAKQFIETLCSLSDVVVFSAAVPKQGGLSHVNEQPQSYWARLFAENGYICVDCIRPSIWNNQNVSFYYKQNILMYVKRNSSGNAAICKYIQKPILDVIHPDIYASVADAWKYEQIRPVRSI